MRGCCVRVVKARVPSVEHVTPMSWEPPPQRTSVEHRVSGAGWKQAVVTSSTVSAYPTCWKLPRVDAFASGEGGHEVGRQLGLRRKRPLRTRQHTSPSQKHKPTPIEERNTRSAAERQDTVLTLLHSAGKDTGLTAEWVGGGGGQKGKQGLGHAGRL